MTIENEVQRYSDTKWNINEHEIDRVANMVEQAVLNYCNLATLPVALHFVAVDMALTILQDKHNATLTAEENLLTKEIKSKSIGRMSITYSDNTRTTSLAQQVDDVVFNYKDQLNRFRVLKW